MQSHNLYVYASLRGATMEQVGSLTEERYQQIQKQVRMDWRLYLRGAISTVSGIYHIFLAALALTPKTLFALIVIAAFFNDESGLSFALAAGIKDPVAATSGLVTLIKLSFGLSLFVVFLRDVLLGAITLSSTYEEAVNHAVAREINLDKNMKIDLIGESIDQFVTRAAKTVKG